VIENDAGSNTLGDRDGDEIPDSLGVAAKPDLGEGARIGRVFEFDWQPKGLLQRRFEVEVAPRQIGVKASR
jgi:hypothetical protein